MIGGRNLNKNRYADHTLLIANTEKKIQGVIENLLKGRVNKRLTINTVRRSNIWLSESEKVELRIGDVNTNMNFKCVGLQKYPENTIGGTREEGHKRKS